MWVLHSHPRVCGIRLHQILVTHLAHLGVIATGVGLTRTQSTLGGRRYRIQIFGSCQDSKLFTTRGGFGTFF